MAICQMLGQVPMSVQAVGIRRRGCFRNKLQILAAATVGALMPTVGFFGGSSKRKAPLAHHPSDGTRTRCDTCVVAFVLCPFGCFQRGPFPSSLLLGVAADPLSPSSNASCWDTDTGMALGTWAHILCFHAEIWRQDKASSKQGELGWSRNSKAKTRAALLERAWRMALNGENGIYHL